MRRKFLIWLPAYVLMAMAFWVVVPITLLWAYSHYYQWQIINVVRPEYPSKVFGDSLGLGDVVALRYGDHHSDEFVSLCWYAALRLHEDAPYEPPHNLAHGKVFFSRGQKDHFFNRHPVSNCLEDIDRTHPSPLLGCISKNGAFYFRGDRFFGTYVYSEPCRFFGVMNND